jgi:mersacidin/lichenicidin family type 2 lantibiotic
MINWIAEKVRCFWRKVIIIMKIDIARAWKDATYRASLSVEEQALIPANPAGAVELSDSELELVHGATGRKDGNSSSNVNNVRIDTSGVLCLHSVQIPINIDVIPVITPQTANTTCY